MKIPDLIPSGTDVRALRNWLNNLRNAVKANRASGDNSTVNVNRTPGGSTISTKKIQETKTIRENSYINVVYDSNNLYFTITVNPWVCMFPESNYNLDQFSIRKISESYKINKPSSSYITVNIVQPFGIYHESDHWFKLFNVNNDTISFYDTATEYSTLDSTQTPANISNIALIQLHSDGTFRLGVSPGITTAGPGFEIIPYPVHRKNMVYFEDGKVFKLLSQQDGSFVEEINLPDSTDSDIYWDYENEQLTLSVPTNGIKLASIETHSNGQVKNFDFSSAGTDLIVESFEYVKDIAYDGGGHVTSKTRHKACFLNQKYVGNYEI